MGCCRKWHSWTLVWIYSYNIGGDISGLSGSVTLQNNSTDDLLINTNGAFTFNTTTLTCVVTGGGAADGSGTIAAADVTDIDVACNP